MRSGAHATFSLHPRTCIQRLRYPHTLPGVSLHAARAKPPSPIPNLSLLWASFFSFSGFALFSNFHRRLVECQSRIAPISRRFAASSSPAVSQILRRPNPLPTRLLLTASRIPPISSAKPNASYIVPSIVVDTTILRESSTASVQDRNRTLWTRRPRPAHTDTRSSCRDTLEVVSSATYPSL